MLCVSARALYGLAARASVGSFNVKYLSDVFVSALCGSWAASVFGHIWHEVGLSLRLQLLGGLSYTTLCPLIHLRVPDLVLL